MDFIYLDAAATTPPHIDVIEEIKRIQLEHWGNPSSIHQLGINASEILERSRNSIALKLNSCSEEIVFTSGASESNDLAIRAISNSVQKGRVVISTVEHPSIKNTVNQLKELGWEVLYWPVDNKGVVKIDIINEILSPPTKFVSLIWGQGEIGTIQPINIIGQACKDRNILFHTDATQVLANGLFDWEKLNVDLLSASSHKLQGPKGVGMLMIKKNSRSKIKPFNTGGMQESSLRSGTQSVPSIAGFAVAINLINKNIEIDNYSTIFSEDKVSLFTNKLNEKLTSNNRLTPTGHDKYRIPNHLSFICHTTSKQPLLGRDVVRQLSKRNIYASSGSACSSSNHGPNSILTAINIDTIYRESGIRFSVGPWIDNYDIDNIYDLVNDSLVELENKVQITNYDG